MCANAPSLHLKSKAAADGGVAAIAHQYAAVCQKLHAIHVVQAAAHERHCNSAAEATKCTAESTSWRVSRGLADHESYAASSGAFYPPSPQTRPSAVRATSLQRGADLLWGCRVTAIYSFCARTLSSCHVSRRLRVPHACRSRSCMRGVSGAPSRRSAFAGSLPSRLVLCRRRPLE